MVAATPASAQTNPTAALGVEWAGGAIGSVAGIGIGRLIADPADCGDDDVGCVLERLMLVGLTTAVTASAGAWSAGELAGNDPSVVGAAVGGLVGVGAGAGAMRLLSELGVEPRGFSAVVVYAVAQGLVTAAGSRIGAGMHD